MSETNLEEPVSVQWLETTPPPGEAERRRSLRFVLLADAVQFVMKTLPEPARATARITLGGGSLDISEIEKLYNGITTEAA